MVFDQLLKTLAEDGCQSKSFKNVVLAVFGIGTMVAVLKHEGTTDRERERLNISVKTLTSWCVHALSTRPVMPSGHAAFRMFKRSCNIRYRDG